MAARVRWLDTGEEFPDGYNCGVCGSYVLALAEIDSGEKLVGKHVMPKIGMRVVGALNSGYEKMGMGVITSIVEKNGTSCHVTWDGFGPGQKFGYCAGFRGRYHLAMVDEMEVSDLEVFENHESVDPGAEYKTSESALVLVGRDVNARIGLRVQNIVVGKEEKYFGTITALREGGNVCDVRWDHSEQVSSGISTGLMNEFHLALHNDNSSSIVIGRDIKPAVGQHVRPLTFTDTGGVEGTFMDSSALEKGQIIQILPEGDVVVRWESNGDAGPRGGIYQTGRHGAYFLALDENGRTLLSSRRAVREASSASILQARIAHHQPLRCERVEEHEPDQRPRVLGRDIPPAIGQIVFALANGSRADKETGTVIRVDPGGLGVTVRWSTGEESAALTGRFDTYDLGTIDEDRPKLNFMT